MTTTSTPAPLPASDFQADPETRIANWHKIGLNHADECFFCGRGLTQSGVDNGWWVHLTTTGRLLARGAAVDSDDDQGFFPVGSECAKKIPVTHRTRA